MASMKVILSVIIIIVVCIGASPLPTPPPSVIPTSPPSVLPTPQMVYDPHTSDIQVSNASTLPSLNVIVVALFLLLVVVHTLAGILYWVSTGSNGSI